VPTGVTRLQRGLPGVGAPGAGSDSGRNAPAPTSTLNLEEMLARGASHLARLVDARGRTYFDVFLTEPPEAVTDWPDFVDLPARYWEACALTTSVLPSLAVPSAKMWIARVRRHR
jgi:hypothetical protein